MKKGIFFILLGTILFSSMETAGKLIVADFHPLQINITRFFLGGLFLLPFARRARRSHPERVDRQSIAYFALVALVGIVFSMTFYQLSLITVPASVVGVLFSSNPIFVFIFAYFLLREEIHAKHVVALALVILGLFVILNPGTIQLDPFGVVCLLLATVSFALYSVLSRRKCARFGGARVTCYIFLLATLEHLLLIALSHIPALGVWLQGRGLALLTEIPLFSGYTAENWWIMLYISIGVTGGGYASHAMALELTSAQKASLVFFFKIALSPLLAMLILQEPLGLRMLMGMLLVLGGSLLTLLPSRLARPKLTSKGV